MLSRCCRQLVFLHECSHDILQKYIGFDYFLSSVASCNLAGKYSLGAVLHFFEPVAGDFWS